MTATSTLSHHFKVRLLLANFTMLCYASVISTEDCAVTFQIKLAFMSYIYMLLTEQAQSRRGCNMGASRIVCCRQVATLPGNSFRLISKAGRQASRAVVVLSGPRCNIYRAHICVPNLGVVVFPCFSSLYCESHPVGLLLTPCHGYFSLASANHMLLRRLPSLWHPIGGRALGKGGIRTPVNHSQEAGERITERARLEELLNKANSSALRKRLLPIRIQHQLGANGRR